MRKPYFPIADNAPEPLRFIVKRTVRFEEVDSMRIVWHGVYPSYFEDARVALGNRYGIGYADFIENRIPVPIKQMGIDYYKPLRFGDEVEIEAILHWSDAARINFEFIIRKYGEITTTGYTVQMMLDDTLELLLTVPDFYLDFLNRWRSGQL